MAWDEHDRAALLALRAEDADRCPQCGHPMSVCRDPRTQGRWEVLEETCEASRVAAVMTENSIQTGDKRRGRVTLTRLRGA